MGTHGTTFSVETLRQWMVTEGVWRTASGQGAAHPWAASLRDSLRSR